MCITEQYFIFIIAGEPILFGQLSVNEHYKERFSCFGVNSCLFLFQHGRYQE